MKTKLNRYTLLLVVLAFFNVDALLYLTFTYHSSEPKNLPRLMVRLDSAKYVGITDKFPGQEAMEHRMKIINR